MVYSKKGNLKLEDKKLISYIKGKATRKEREEVLNWLEQPGSREELDKLVERYLDNPGWDNDDETDYPKLLNNIHGRIRQSEGKADKGESWYPKSLLKIAAGLLLFGLGIFYVIGEFGFGFKEVTVVAEEFSSITKETGVGEKLTLTLSDGTKVTLNALSKVGFTSGYGKSERLISLEGEAYFEIAPDEKRPFKLETGPVTTTALGTAFNAFSREGHIKIALTEGKVNVESVNQMVELTPGKMALLDSVGEMPELSVTPFDQSKVIAWKEGRIAFDRKPLKEILKDLEDWYGVRMEVQKGVDVNRKVIGEFNNRSLKDILVGLDFSMGLEHKIVGDQVTIKSN